jgi:hypothetical protein
MELPKELDPNQGPDIAVAVTIQSDVNPRRKIVMQTFIGRDVHVKEFHALTDKLSSVIDRQEAKFDLEGLKLNIEADRRGLEAAKDAYANIEKLNASQWQSRGKKGEPVLSPAETQSKLNHATNIRAFNKAIEKKEAEVAELEAKIAKVD